MQTMNIDAFGKTALRACDIVVPVDAVIKDTVFNAETGRCVTSDRPISGLVFRLYFEPTEASPEPSEWARKACDIAGSMLGNHYGGHLQTMPDEPMNSEDMLAFQGKLKERLNSALNAEQVAFFMSQHMGYLQ